MVSEAEGENYTGVWSKTPDGLAGRSARPKRWEACLVGSMLGHGVCPNKDLSTDYKPRSWDSTRNKAIVQTCMFSCHGSWEGQCFSKMVASVSLETRENDG